MSLDNIDGVVEHGIISKFPLSFLFPSILTSAFTDMICVLLYK